MVCLHRFRTANLDVSIVWGKNRRGTKFIHHHFELPTSKGITNLIYILAYPFSLNCRFLRRIRCLVEVKWHCQMRMQAFVMPHIFRWTAADRPFTVWAKNRLVSMGFSVMCNCFGSIFHLCETLWHRAFIEMAFGPSIQRDLSTARQNNRVFILHHFVGVLLLEFKFKWKTIL